MARHNPIFGHDQAVQQGSSQPSYGYAQNQGTASQTPSAQTQWAPSFGQQTQQGYQQGEDLEAIYARPSATGHDTGRMTMRDALNAITATLGTIIVIGVAVATLPALLGFVAGDSGQALGYGVAMVALVIGLIGGLVTGLVNAFKRQPSAVLTLLYAVFEGLLLGGFSAMMETVYSGIALQAVIGTLGVAATVLVLFRLGVLRTSPLLTKIFMVAMIGYLLFGLFNIGYMLMTGGSLRDGLPGLIIGGLAIVMASYSLVMDFEDVQRATNAGVARQYAWRCAFGLAATLVWMYIEVLRILAIFRGD